MTIASLAGKTLIAAVTASAAFALSQSAAHADSASSAVTMSSVVGTCGHVDLTFTNAGPAVDILIVDTPADEPPLAPGTPIHLAADQTLHMPYVLALEGVYNNPRPDFVAAREDITNLPVGYVSVPRNCELTGKPVAASPLVPHTYPVTPGTRTTAPRSTAAKSEAPKTAIAGPVVTVEASRNPYIICWVI